MYGFQVPSGWSNAGARYYSPSDKSAYDTYVADYKHKEGIARQDQLMGEYQAAYNEAKAANEQRYDQGLGIYDNLISMYQPGGDYGKGAMAGYDRGKQKSMATAYQGLVNSGMSNLTKGAGFGKAYEEEVGNPFRLNLNDSRYNALTNALLGKVGFIERRTDAYPDQSLYVNLMNQLGNAGY